MRSCFRSDVSDRPMHENVRYRGKRSAIEMTPHLIIRLILPCEEVEAEHEYQGRYGRQHVLHQGRVQDPLQEDDDNESSPFY